MQYKLRMVGRLRGGYAAATRSGRNFGVTAFQKWVSVRIGAGSQRFTGPRSRAFDQGAEKTLKMARNTHKYRTGGYVAAT